MMRRQLAYKSSFPQPNHPSTTKTGQQDDLLMQPQALQHDFPSHQPFPSVSLHGQGDPLTRVLHWMGHHELRDNAYSSSSTTVPNDKTEDDAMLDAQLDAGSASHREGVVAQAIRPSRHIKRATSTEESKVKCNPLQWPSTQCFTKGECFTSRDLFLDEETQRWEERQQKKWCNWEACSLP